MTEIACVVAPLLQAYESDVLAVKVIVSPEHAAVTGAVTVGSGALLTFTDIGCEVD